MLNTWRNEPGRVQLVWYCAPDDAVTEALVRWMIRAGLRARKRTAGTVRVDHAPSIARLVWLTHDSDVLVRAAIRYAQAWKGAKMGTPVPPDVQKERTVAAADLVHVWRRLAGEHESR